MTSFIVIYRDVMTAKNKSSFAWHKILIFIITI
jgi:hypothetical protein